MDSSCILLCFLASLVCVSADTSVYNVIVQQKPTIPQPEYSFEETECQLTVSHPDNNTFCESNINTVFNDVVNLTIDNPALQYCSYQLNCMDEQCGENEFGQLCKACKGNYSRIFGGPGCKECTNLHLLLIIPFAVAGIVLLFVILKCNLTVANGQIISILFYANVLHVYSRIQFREFKNELQFFSVFIAWLNLDLGIGTCFFNGMDAYTKAWLQFAFPVYLWILIGVLFILTKVYPPISKFFGGNCVPSLSVTIIILSYSKIAQNIKTALSFTWKNDTLNQIPVWYEDDTVKYLGPKHSALFAMAILVALLYILPVTLIGLFAPCLQAHSHRKALKWIKKLKPFLDAYQAPYNKKFQHWTGLMLVIRVGIYLLLATNRLQDASMAYFLIVTIVGPISIFVTVKKNKTVYRRQFPNCLEAISLLNLTLLNLLSWFLTTTIYTRAIALKQYITYVSISITMLLLLLVILYQVSLIICPQIFFNSRRNTSREEEFIEESISSTDSEAEIEVINTSSFIQESPDLEQKNQLRVPLIETS